MNLDLSFDISVLQAKHVIEALIVKDNDIVVRRVQLKVSNRSLDSEKLLDRPR